MPLLKQSPPIRKQYLCTHILKPFQISVYSEVLVDFLWQFFLYLAFCFSFRFFSPFFTHTKHLFRLKSIHTKVYHVYPWQYLSLKNWNKYKGLSKMSKIWTFSLAIKVAVYWFPQKLTRDQPLSCNWPFSTIRVLLLNQDVRSIPKWCTMTTEYTVMSQAKLQKITEYCLDSICEVMATGIRSLLLGNIALQSIGGTLQLFSNLPLRRILSGPHSKIY